MRPPRGRSPDLGYAHGRVLLDGPDVRGQELLLGLVQLGHGLLVLLLAFALRPALGLAVVLAAVDDLVLVVVLFWKRERETRKRKKENETVYVHPQKINMHPRSRACDS